MVPAALCCRDFFVQKIEDNRKLSSIQTDLKCPVGYPDAANIFYAFLRQKSNHFMGILFSERWVLSARTSWTNISAKKRQNSRFFPIFGDNKAKKRGHKTSLFCWRREWDLNPRIHPCITRFRIVRVRPLRHLCNYPPILH